MKLRDREDKSLHKQRLREKRTKEKMKLKRWREEDDSGEEATSEQDEVAEKKVSKRTKIYFDSDDDEHEQKGKKDVGLPADSISLAEQEALALKLLSSMHS